MTNRIGAPSGRCPDARVELDDAAARVLAFGRRLEVEAEDVSLMASSLWCVRVTLSESSSAGSNRDLRPLLTRMWLVACFCPCGPNEWGARKLSDADVSSETQWAAVLGWTPCAGGSSGGSMSAKWVRAVSVVAACAFVVAMSGSIAAADDGSLPSTSTGGTGETAVIHAGSASRALAATSANSAADQTETVTFSEFPIGTRIASQYQDRGIMFGGDSPFITTDGANPTSPVLSGTPTFQGTVEGTFVMKDGSPRTVNHLQLDVGYIDTARSVYVLVYGADGGQLLAIPLAANGIVHVDIDQLGMASFRVETVTDEPAGFAVDNVSYPSPDLPPVIDLDKYVALGDSYQSGQGVGNYEPGTDNDGNGCRRSYDAYPYRLVADGVVNLTLDFRACSGATITDFYDSQKADQGPQLDALGSDTRLVTIGIVGNDLEFSGIMTACLATVTGNILSPALTWWRSCARNEGGWVDGNIASLRSGQLHTNLLELYRDVRRRAPSARVIVVDYPEFFPSQGVGGYYSGCYGVRSSDQVWIDEKIRQADETIGSIAAEAGFEYVSMADVLTGHQVCTDDPAMNGVVATDRVASFHPNALGHSLIADRLESHIGQPVNPTFVIRSHETVVTHYEIRGSVLSLNIGWPGSDVVTNLVSPSGVRYTRDAPGAATHDVGPTWEYYTITDPEPGTWTVESYGADVAADGEPVTYSLADLTAPNQAPTANVTTTQSGGTFTFDASGSSDPDGTIVDYQWEFADGATASGPVVTHTFAPGVYDVTLVTTDNQGAKGFGYADHVIHVGSVLTGTSLFSGSSLQVTNNVTVGGSGEDVRVAGDLECNSNGHIAGDVSVTGAAHLTNHCTIDGSLTVSGDVLLDSNASVAGDVTAGGQIRFQSTGHLGGNVTAGSTFAVIDGVPIDDLHADGALAGSVTEHAEVSAVDFGAPPVVAAPQGTSDRDLTWAQWLHATAVAAQAPAWSTGLSNQPGCALASWSVGTSTVTVDADTMVDARASTSGCSAIDLHGLTIKLSGDLTILADSVQSPNGLHLESADGMPHTVRILVPGTVSGQSGNGGITLLGGTTADSMLTVEVGTPGAVALSGGVNIVGQIAAGSVSADGQVHIESRTSA